MTCKVAAMALWALLLAPSFTFAEVTKEDLQELKADLKEDIARVKEDVARVKEDVGRLKEHMDVRFEALQRELRMVEWPVGALIIIVVAVLAVPQVVGLVRERRDIAELRQRLREVEVKLGHKQ